MLGSEGFKRRRFSNLSKEQLIKELPTKLKLWFLFWNYLSVVLAALIFMLLGVNIIYSTILLFMHNLKSFIASILWTLQLIGAFIFINRVKESS